jgi:trimeric autotransporter adhesin
MKHRTITLVAALTLAASGYGQAFTGTYLFTDVTTGTGTIDPTAVPTATGIAFGSFSAVGVSANSNAGGRFSFTGWSTGASDGSDTFAGAIDLSDYFQVTIAPAALHSMDLTSITFTLQRSGTGIRQYSVRSSLDGYVSNLGASVSPANANLSVVGGDIFQVADTATTAQNGSLLSLSGSFLELEAPVTFRFYAWNAEASGGTFSIDNVTFTGTATAIPEPSTYALIMGVLTFGFIVWHRRPKA